MSIYLRSRYGLHKFFVLFRIFIQRSRYYSNHGIKTNIMPDADSHVQKDDLSVQQSIHRLGEHQVRIAEAQNVIEVLTKLEMLMGGQGDPPQHCWHLCLDGKGIRRSFYFRGFIKTWVGRVWSSQMNNTRVTDSV